MVEDAAGKPDETASKSLVSTRALLILVLAMAVGLLSGVAAAVAAWSGAVAVLGDGLAVFTALVAGCSVGILIFLKVAEQVHRLVR